MKKMTLFASLLASFFLLIGTIAFAINGTPVLIKKVSCTAIREEPGAPTQSFELVISNNNSYEARFLNLPGNESAPPVVLASIPGLQCRFLSSNGFFFQCQKEGASLKSVEITENSLRLIGDEMQTDVFREFRAVGNAVPNIFMVFRFGRADTCAVSE
jgi:hypothetical protein